MPAQAAVTSDYYVAQTPKLMGQFDKYFKRLHRLLARDYGEEFAATIENDTRERFERIIPELPYIGGKENHYTAVMVINGWLVSLYRSMKANGKPVEETARLCCEAVEEYFNRGPRWLRRLIGRLALTTPVRKSLEKQALASQRRRFSEDFVWEVHANDADGFDATLEFSECAVNKFYDSQDAAELKPYCCFFDVIYGKALGMGVTADETLGIGSPTCRLRYKKGAATKVPTQLLDFIAADEQSSPAR